MMTMRIDDYQFKIDMKAFRRRSGIDFKRAILEATLTLEKMAKLKVRNFTSSSRVRRGYLVSHITKRITSAGLTGEVTSGANYSQAFEEGTRPHIIRVKNKKILAGPRRGAPPGWNVNKKSTSWQMGYVTYGREVRHPGTHPHPFMFPAWKYACQRLEKILKRALT
jgi:hypothetical protein